MKREELERSLGKTPQLFLDRVDDTLRTLKEEPPMKKQIGRTLCIALLVTLSLCGLAYAIVVSQGQEWYYTHRFTAYQEYEPEKQQAILQQLQTDVPQEQSADAQGLIAVTVQDYVWSKEQQFFSLSVAARATDPATYELHPMHNLDADGAYGDDPSDPDSHAAHYLWTEKGNGLPQDVMDDPAKKLLLVEFTEGAGMLYIGDTDCLFPVYASDAFVAEDGAVVYVLKCDLRALTEEALPVTPETYAALRPLDPDNEDTDPSPETMEAVLRLQSRLSELEFYNGEFNGLYDKAVQESVAAFQRMNHLTPDGVAGIYTQQALYGASPVNALGEQVEMDAAPSLRRILTENTDAEGNLALRLEYNVAPLTEDVLGDPIPGSISFQVKITEHSVK